MQTQVFKGVSTSVYSDNGVTHCQYHNTRVVSFDSEAITLRTGGWSTVTTKTRMNQASNQFGLGYQVFQKNFDWFVDYHGSVIPFDGNELTLIR